MGNVVSSGVGGDGRGNRLDDGAFFVGKVDIDHFDHFDHHHRIQWAVMMVNDRESTLGMMVVDRVGGCGGEGWW